MEKMSSAFVLIFLIFGQVLLQTSNGVQGKQYFGIGTRQEGDSLVLKDILSSRPAGISEPPRVAFTYNITEPITYIEFTSEENISAEVKLSYFDSLVVGEVRLVTNNESDGEDFSIETQSEGPAIETPSGFDVLIMMFGFDESVKFYDPGLVLNHDTQYEGDLEPYDNEESVTTVENIDIVQAGNDEPINDTVDHELKDKIFEIGERQPGDDLLFESSSSTAGSETPTNQTLTFYYIDSVYITYIKFVIFDHFTNNAVTSNDYNPPVVEYSHYTAGTFKATITEYDTMLTFAQMFVYGYADINALPDDYKPFLPPQERTLPPPRVHLTPQERLQLLLMTQQATTPTSLNDNNDDDDDDSQESIIGPEDMIPDHKPRRLPSIPNSALEQQRTVEQRLFAMLGLMLYAVA